MPDYTGSGIGRSVGRFGLGAIGFGLGGPLGGLLGQAIGRPLGGLVGGGLSSLFGPRGLPAAGGLAGRGIGLLPAFSGMSVPIAGGPPTYTGQNNLFGANVPGAPESSIDPTGALANAASAGYPSVNPVAAAATVGRTAGLAPVSNYGQIAKGLPAFASENRAQILKRNII